MRRAVVFGGQKGEDMLQAQFYSGAQTGFISNFCLHLCRLLGLCLFIVCLGLATVAHSAEKAYLICISKNLNGDIEWNWAKEDGSESIPVMGYRFNMLHESYFLANQQSSDVLKKICKETIESSRGAKSTLVDIRVRNSIFAAEYGIEFPKGDKKSALIDIQTELKDFFTEELVPFVKNELELRENSKLLLKFTKEYLNLNKDAPNKLARFVVEGSRYNNPVIEWEKSTWTERLDQFLELFRDETDSDILLYSLTGKNGGQSRGAFNSYVDLTTFAFLHSFDSPSAKILMFLNISNQDDLKTYAICNMVFKAAALKGMVERFSRLATELDQEDLLVVYSGFLGTASLILSDLNNLRSYIRSQEQLRKLDMIKNKLEMTIFHSLQKL